MDHLPRRTEVFAFQQGADVVRECQRGFFAQNLANVLSRFPVSGIDHGKPETGAEPGPWVCRGDELGEFHNVAHGAAVRSPREKHHVRPQMADAFDLLVWQAAVVGREDVHHDGARAEGRPLGAFSGHRLDNPAHHHLEAASCAARGHIDVDAAAAICGRENAFAFQDGAPGEFFNLLDGVEDASGDVFERSLDRCGRLTAAGLPVAFSLFFYKDGLGGRAAAVRGDDDVRLIHSVGFPPPQENRSVSAHSGVSPENARIDCIPRLRR